MEISSVDVRRCEAAALAVSQLRRIEFSKKISYTVCRLMRRAKRVHPNTNKTRLWSSRSRTPGTAMLQKLYTAVQQAAVRKTNDALPYLTFELSAAARHFAGFDDARGQDIRPATVQVVRLHDAPPLHRPAAARRNLFGMGSEHVSSIGRRRRDRNV